MKLVFYFVFGLSFFHLENRAFSSGLQTFINSCSFEAEGTQVGLQVLTYKNLNINTRDLLLENFFKTCEKTPVFKTAIIDLAVAPNLEWSLKQKALVWHQTHSEQCSPKIITHLLQLFSEDGNWHVRDAALWFLSNVSKEGDCDEQIISFLSDLIQQDAHQMSVQAVNFRQIKIKTILWVLVRLAVRHQDEAVALEFKRMAMHHNLNMYFRITAVEALQDLSLYSPAAAQSLYEIVRDTKRVRQSDFVTYYQGIRDKQDTKVRNYALASLANLIGTDQSDFLPFLNQNFLDRVDSDQIHRIKAFENQSIPADLGLYARPALLQLSQDSQVDQKSRASAHNILNGSVEIP